MKIKHIATFFIICSISSCSLILPLSIVDESAKMDLISTDEYYEQFVRFAQMKAEFGSNYNISEKTFTTEYTYLLDSESDWQKNYVTFSVNNNDSIESFFGNGLEYGLPRYIAKCEIREKRKPMYIYGVLIDASVAILINVIVALYN